MGRALWREKLLTFFALAYISYFGYFREAYFIDISRKRIRMFEIAKAYDK
jgi:hypothetical protein